MSRTKRDEIWRLAPLKAHGPAECAGLLGLELGGFGTGIWNTPGTMAKPGAADSIASRIPPGLFRVKRDKGKSHEQEHQMKVTTVGTTAIEILKT